MRACLVSSKYHPILSFAYILIYSLIKLKQLKKYAIYLCSILPLFPLTKNSSPRIIVFDIFFYYSTYWRTKSILLFQIKTYFEVYYRFSPKMILHYIKILFFLKIKTYIRENLRSNAYISIKWNFILNWKIKIFFMPIWVQIKN